MKKDDGRMQAYGWSLPAKTGQRAIEGSSGSQGASQPSRSTTSHLPVPVPVYCRPLMEKEPGMKVGHTHLFSSGHRLREIII